MKIVFFSGLLFASKPIDGLKSSVIISLARSLKHKINTSKKRGKNPFHRLCSVGWVVCQHDHTQSTEHISLKLGLRMGVSPLQV